MAGRLVPVRTWPGFIAATLVAAMVFGPLVAVALRAEPWQGFGAGDLAAIRFTVLQATLSAVLSVALAIPCARALSRRRFPGRKALIALLGAPFILPVIVAVLGLLAVFGRNGLLNEALRWAGVGEVQIYGLHGVVMAHVFFNLPLATRLILSGWQQVPAERFRLAAQLGFGPREMWTVIERPMLRQTMLPAFVVVFAICLSSFAVALTLGGGPRATTVELAIYQAFRFDFDLGRAAFLALIQIVLAGAAGLVALRLAGRGGFGAGLDRPITRWDKAEGWRRGADGGILILVSMFLLLPVGMVVISGVPGLMSMPVQVWSAAGLSLGVALGSTLIMLLLALPISVAASGRHGWIESIGLLGIAASPLVIGTGLFILIFPLADPFKLALLVTAFVNAMSALPFALRILAGPVRDILRDFGRLSLSLRLTGWSWVRLIMLPRLRGPLGFACGLTAALSMGDLGVIALFADPEAATLPLQMYRLMGAYRMEAANGAALLLLILSFGAFWVFDKGGRGNARS